MRMRRALGVSFAALVLSTGAFTQEAQSADEREQHTNRGSAGFGSPDQYIAPAPGNRQRSRSSAGAKSAGHPGTATATSAG